MFNFLLESNIVAAGEDRKQLARTKPITSGDAGIVVNGICPDTTFRFLEGVDNSDLRTLLALAIQVADAKG
jgi:hypothetical protein